MNDDDATVLVVDDLPQNVRLMDAVLSPLGFTVVSAMSGEEALDQLARELPDIVLLDIMMPGMDGYETCRRIRANPATSFIPVVMVTASGDAEKVRAIEVGADDFVTKPLNKAELLARVRSLVRVKRYHDTVVAQSAALAEWNTTLEQRVAAQVAELDRLGRLRRFLSPQIAQLVVDTGDESFLRSHRRQFRFERALLAYVKARTRTREPLRIQAAHTALVAALQALEADPREQAVFDHLDPLCYALAKECGRTMSDLARERAQQVRTVPKPSSHGRKAA